MPHWHEYNPWKDEVVYVPIEELAECYYGLGKSCTDVDGSRFIWTVERVLQHWRQGGYKLDAYILPSGSGDHCMGIRYGKRDSAYLSPMPDPDKISALLKKYRGK